MDSQQTLLEMGFDQARIQHAIQATNSQDIQVLITFLEQSQDQEPQQQVNAPVQQGQSISGLVNQEHVAVLLSLGHSKFVSEKALLYTGNKGTEAALAWIEEHKTDGDFEEEALIQQEKKLSPEEVQQRVKELQQRIREKRKKEEEEYALEQERNRIKSGKQMSDTRRELDELRKKQDAEALKRQRQQDEKDRQAILAQLQRDKELRFGKQPGAPQQQQQQQQKVLSAIELFDVGIKQIKAAQPPDLVPDVAFNSYTLIKRILENIIKNPAEPKFRKIQLTSQVYQTKIEQVFGAKNALDGLGFVEEEGFYVIHSQDVTLLTKALEIVSKELSQI